MRTYNPLRPNHLAILVAMAVRSAVSGRYVLNVKQEVDRIAAETGFAVHTVARESLRLTQRPPSSFQE
jgi:hypothetical protein